MKKNLIFRLLLKNTSVPRIIGFILSNFLGLAIIIGGIIFYRDANSLWTSEDSFIKKDYLVVNKKIASSDIWGDGDTSFSRQDIESLKAQPWVNDVGVFTANDYRIWATVGGNGAGGRGMSTMLFFESVPNRYVDGIDSSDWDFSPGENAVPVIISKDYLTLYNFGFAGSQGLPQLSENLMGSIPLHLQLTSEDGTRVKEMDARIVGFSNRLNTILVPESFMEWSNNELGKNKGVGEEEESPSRLIIDVNSPGDVAIAEYLDAHGIEMAGDKSSSSASFLLKVITGIILLVGSVITAMSFFILLLSVSLLMEKNREKLHSLLMLGYPLIKVATPYIFIILLSSLLAYGGAVLCGLLLRGTYITALEGLGSMPESPWVGLFVGAMITLAVILVNMIAVYRRVLSSWRITR